MSETATERRGVPRRVNDSLSGTNPVPKGHDKKARHVIAGNDDVKTRRVPAGTALAVFVAYFVPLG
jgi:hypothetical protein